MRSYLNQICEPQKKLSPTLKSFSLIIQYLGASDCKLQEGSMRADVNLSVREVGAEEFGTRTEMKNLNSFKRNRTSNRGRDENAQIELD